MADDLRNIKVKSDTFERLKADKPDGVTWDYFLDACRQAWRNPYKSEPGVSDE